MPSRVTGSGGPQRRGASSPRARWWAGAPAFPGSSPCPGVPGSLSPEGAATHPAAPGSRAFTNNLSPGNKSPHSARETRPINHGDGAEEGHPRPAGPPTLAAGPAQRPRRPCPVMEGQSAPDDISGLSKCHPGNDLALRWGEGWFRVRLKSSGPGLLLSPADVRDGARASGPCWSASWSAWLGFGARSFGHTLSYTVP